MAEEKDYKAEKKKIQDEKKKLRNDEKARQKEARKKARELADQEAELDDDSPGGGFSMLVVTLFIILIWVVIIGILIKLDIAGIGSKFLAPAIKDIPVINKILPKDSITETDDLEAYYGYTSLADAVDQIKALEMELTSAQSANNTNLAEIEKLKAEVTRLKTFEDQQVEFQRIKTEFYEDVIYAENGPGAEEYKKYYEAIDPATAEYLYQQVATKEQTDAQMESYAKAYASMDPKEAAGIFNTMTANLELVGRILWSMTAEQRGAILGVMDPDIAAQVTKIMDPQ